jgi:hypothetical protein
MFQIVSIRLNSLHSLIFWHHRENVHFRPQWGSLGVKSDSQKKTFLRLGLTGVLTFAQVTLGKATPPNVVGRSCLAARSVAKGSTNQVAKGSGFYDWKTFRTFRSPVYSYYEFLRGHTQPIGIDKALTLPALDLAVKGCWLIFHQGKPANPQRKHRHH